MKLSAEISEYLLLAEADLKQNLAKRILFSLLAKLLDAGEAQTRLHQTKGIVDYNALKQMIPGAKELIHFGTQAAFNEAAEHYRGEKDLESMLSTPNDDQKLIYLQQIFEEKDAWESQMGGKKWAKIAETLYNIHKSLKMAEAVKSQDLEAFYDYLMEMTAYMNVLDGLVHNTGSIIEKMVDLERGEREEELPENISDYERLMDAKELPDEEDVLAEIYPTLEKSDAPLTMKDWLSRTRQRKQNFTHPEKSKARDIKLQAIREKKVRAEDLQILKDNVKYDLLKQIINKPDSFILDYVRSVDFARQFYFFAARTSFGSLAPLASGRIKTEALKYRRQLEFRSPLSYYEARQIIELVIDTVDHLEVEIEKRFDSTMNLL